MIHKIMHAYANDSFFMPLSDWSKVESHFQRYTFFSKMCIKMYIPEKQLEKNTHYLFTSSS